MLDSLTDAHNFILFDKEDVWDAGTSTLVGITVIPLKSRTKTPYQEWACVILNVGDCKATQNNFEMTINSHRRFAGPACTIN